MKEIIIDGRKLLYEIEEGPHKKHPTFSSAPSTVFYTTENLEETKPGLWSFISGKIPMYEVVLIVAYSIEDLNYSKGIMKEMILKSFKEVEERNRGMAKYEERLEKRRLEILNGEII